MSQRDLQLLATKDGSYTLYDSGLDETYHSKFGAESESDTVFILNTGVEGRLKQQLPTQVLEIGFGTGYNFVRTAANAIAANCALHYTGIEMRPPPVDLAKALLLQNAPNQKALCEFASDTLSRTQLHTETGNISFDSLVSLNLIHADARQWALAADQFDAIYLDAFSIKNNPDLWQAPFLEKLYSTLNPKGTLATYSVGRSFRDALTAAGFDWQKLPGPAGKREVLIAKIPNSARSDDLASDSTQFGQ